MKQRLWNCSDVYIWRVLLEEVMELEDAHELLAFVIVKVLINAIKFGIVW